MKTKDFPQFRFYVNIIGDESVGIFADEAIVTIQDNIVRPTQYDVITLKESIASIYDVSTSCVVTELKHTQDELRSLNMEIDMLKDAINETESNKLSGELNKSLRDIKRRKKGILSKIRELKAFYLKHNFYFPEKRIEQEKSSK